ncbi:DDE_3 domain-containing protein [Trichonephila clavipes]|nr:DDE_3 domain-containing protein [Trichonephila clavipes]
MIGHIYRDVILEQHVRLFRGAMGAEFLFMDDNARPHRANIVDGCLQSEDITRMDFPAYSPDLNPIEYVWDMLGRRIAARQPPSTCLQELWRALLDEWCNIPQNQIDNLILSMPRLCKACIASSGRYTPYYNHHTNHVILFFVNRFFFEICSREKLQHGVRCIDDHSYRCFTAGQRRIFNSVVSESRHVINDLCVPGELQEDYLQYAPCLRNVSTDVRKCAQQYRRLASTYGDYGDSDVNDKLKKHCCVFTEFVQCQHEHLLRDCGTAADQFFQRHVDRMSGSLINEHCVLFTYGSNACIFESNSVNIAFAWIDGVTTAVREECGSFVRPGSPMKEGKLDLGTIRSNVHTYTVGHKKCKGPATLKEAYKPSEIYNMLCQR